MKKILAFALTFVMLLSFAACGGDKNNDDTVTTEPTVTTEAPVEDKVVDPTDALNSIYKALPDDFKFPAGGGDGNNMVMDGAGKFAFDGEENAAAIDAVLGFPVALVSKIDNAASIMHMMNANTFTAGAYHFVSAEDASASVETIKSNILARRWMCGFPETLIIVDLGGNTLLTAFGNGQVIDAFKTATLNTIEGSTVVVETPIG